jgi:hypothetical protein
LSAIVGAREIAIVGAVRGKPILHGSKARHARVGALVRAIAGRLLHGPGDVTYSVVEERLERRNEARRPARLQSGKILDFGERFLTEFVFRNRSEAGVRLRLAHRVVLPKRVLLFDDQCAALHVATVVWQRGCDAGCRVSVERAPSAEPLLSRLRNPYYSIG